MTYQKEAQAYIKLLERAGEKYSRFMLFAYGDADSDALDNVKETIGSVPGAMLRFTDRSFIPYPHDWAFDDSHMDQFVEMYLRKKFNRTQSPASSRNQEFLKKLNAIKILNNYTFDEIAQNNSHVFIFFFSSLKKDPEYYFSYNHLDKITLYRR